MIEHGAHQWKISFIPLYYPTPSKLPTSESFLLNLIISMLFPITLNLEVQVSLGITLRTHIHCKFSRPAADTGQNTLALLL